MRAYILLDLKPGAENEVFQRISIIESVKFIDVVHGAHDIVVVIEGDYETVDKTIMQIRRIPKIHKSESLLSLKPEAWEEISYNLTSGHLAKKRIT